MYIICVYIYIHIYIYTYTIQIYIYFVCSVRTLICAICISVYLQACAQQRPGNVLTIVDVLEEVKYIVNRPGFY